MTVVLKLGGSVLTEKDRVETVDEESLGVAADALGAAGIERLVVVHGGGSFGHPHAAEHGITETDGSHDAPGVAAVHAAMTDLSDAVVSALHDRGVPALPVRPLSVACREDAGLTLPAGAVRRQLAEGFVPVAHGDVVAHAGEGATILSGDDIVASLARSLSADRVGLCSGVPGVLDGSGAVIDRVASFADVADAVGESDATDVTGGMAGKVQALLDLPVPAHVFGLSELPEFLDGGSPGTEICRERP